MTGKLTASDGVDQSIEGGAFQSVGHPFILFVVGIICWGGEGRKQRELSLQK